MDIRNSGQRTNGGYRSKSTEKNFLNENAYIYSTAKMSSLNTFAFCAKTSVNLQMLLTH